MTTHPLRAVFAATVIASAAAAQPPATPHELLQATLWVQGASEYRAAARQAFAVATRTLDRALADPTWSALVSPPAGAPDRPPAVIVDVDETVLDNTRYQARLVLENARYGGETWAAWTAECDAPAVPGARPFCRHAAERGVTVFYVTNRRHAAREATRKNLAALGFPVDEAGATILTRGSSTSKIERRARIAKTHRVLVIVGDNASDFDGAFERADRATRDALVEKHGPWWGERWVILPNPMYGSWENALLGDDRRTRGPDRLDAKHARLDPGAKWRRPAASADTTGIAAGPMPAWSTMTEVAIWLQTRRPARVQLRYWPRGAATEARLTEPTSTDASGDHIATVVVDGLRTGTRYDYEVYVDGARRRFAHRLSFRTQPQWRWRSDPPPITFAFGSCAFVNDPPFDRPGPGYGGDFGIFDAIAATRPDFMLWVGDNTYLREPELHTESAMRYRYRHTRGFAPMQRLLASTHHYAIWDDHDYGPDNSDRSFPLKQTALRVFRDYWPAPAYGTPSAPGCYHRFTWGDADFFLLDDRTYREPAPAEGQYAEDYLGATQLAWLIDGLRTSDATLKFVVNGNQVLNTISKHERYTRFAEGRRLFEAIRRHRIGGVMFLSGDRHIAELNVARLDGLYPLYDFTSSPLTSGAGYHADEKDNPSRVDGTWVTRTRNFGRVAITGPKDDRRVVLSCHGPDGATLWQHVVRATDLRSPE